MLCLCFAFLAVAMGVHSGGESFGNIIHHHTQMMRSVFGVCNEEKAL